MRFRNSSREVAVRVSPSCVLTLRAATFREVIGVDGFDCCEHLEHFRGRSRADADSRIH